MMRRALVLIVLPALLWACDDTVAPRPDAGATDGDAATGDGGGEERKDCSFEIDGTIEYLATCCALSRTSAGEERVVNVELAGNGVTVRLGVLFNENDPAEVEVPFKPTATEIFDDGPNPATANMKLGDAQCKSGSGTMRVFDTIERGVDFEFNANCSDGKAAKVTGYLKSTTGLAACR